MTGGLMGRGSDTRMYSPKSESSILFRYNDGDSRYSPTDPRYADQEKEKKQEEQDNQEKKERSRKHIKVTPEIMQEFKDEPNEEVREDETDKLDAESEISALTGPPGNGGALASLATGARGPGFAYGHSVAMSEPMKNAWSSLLKSYGESHGDVSMLRNLRESGRSDDKSTTNERRKKFKPSTGAFAKPPGGMSGGIKSTPRSYKSKRRGISSGKKSGLQNAPLSVEMEHRTIATKQPMSKDPAKYRNYMGSQGSRKRMGNVRVTESTPNAGNPRTYTAGATGAGVIQSKLPSEVKVKVPKPRLKPHRAPPIVPPTISGMPHLNMGGSTQPFSGSMASNSMVKSAKWQEREYMRLLALKVSRLLDKKENKKKGKVEALPKHGENGPKQTNRNEGATENDFNDPRLFGLDPTNIISGKGGHTP